MTRTNFRIHFSMEFDLCIDMTFCVYFIKNFVMLLTPLGPEVFCQEETVQPNELNYIDPWYGDYIDIAWHLCPKWLATRHTSESNSANQGW